MTRRPIPFEFSRYPVVSNSVGGASFFGLDLEEISSDVLSDDVFENFDSGAARGALPDKLLKDSQHGLTSVESEAELKKMLEDEYQRGLAEGVKKGIDSGKEIAKKEYEARTARIESDIRKAVGEFREMTERAETEAVKLALDVARKVVELSAEIKPEYVIEVIRRGLRNVGAGEVARIRLADPDFEFMQVVGFPTDITAEELGIQYVPDESLKSGCVIETNFGEIDLRLDEMWDQIRQQILGGD